MLESLKLNRDDVVNEVNSVATSATMKSEALSVPSPKILESAQGLADLSDEALMMGYAKGNMQAFEKLYARHKDPLLRYFLRQTSERASAEELFQETWQSLIRNSGSYQTSAKFSTYLYRIAHSRLVDFYRKQGKVNWQSLEQSVEDSSVNIPVDKRSDSRPEQQQSLSETQTNLQKALECLPLEQKEVVILKFGKGFSIKDIAETLGENPEAVKSRLRYGLSKLKKHFENNGLMGFEFASGEDYES